MNRIELTFPNTVRALVHNPYGKEIYESQVADKIDFNDINVIVFPPEIVRASSSFVQGFFSAIIQKIGYEGLNDRVRIESGQETLKSSIQNNLT